MEDLIQLEPTPTYTTRNGISINPDGVSVKGCSYIYAPRGQAGEYSPLAVNPYRGCSHRCAYCLSEDTLVLMADGTTQPIGTLSIGDKIIGIVKRDEIRRAWNYSYAEAEVLNTLRTRKRAFLVTLTNGQTAVCSEDHRWLTERGWKHTSRLTKNNHIRILGPTVATTEESADYALGYLAAIIRGDGTLKRYDYSGKYKRRNRKQAQQRDIQHHFRLAMNDTDALYRAERYLQDNGVTTTRFQFKHGETESPAIRTNSEVSFGKITDLIAIRESLEWKRGWLAGSFDAEGSNSSALRIHNKNEVYLATTQDAFAVYGFQTVRDALQKNGCGAIRLRGGIAAATRFYNLTHPAIARKFRLAGRGLRLAARVASVTDLGETIDMVDITTSTENFIANGMVSHNCYVPNVLKMDRRVFDEAAIPRPSFLDNLRKDARKYQKAGITEQVMGSFTSDMWNPSDRSLTRATWEILIEHGLGICGLTKGGTRALEDIDIFRPDRDAFASTLTSLDDAFSLKWERGAALPQDRIAALKAYHDKGIFTWVSLEPTLDCDASLEIVRQTHSFVDLYKVGRVNYVGLTKTTNWEEYTHRMIDLLDILGAKAYIKKDLQKYLPAGFSNPLRVPQHH